MRIIAFPLFLYRFTMSFYIGFFCIVGGGGSYFERAAMQRNLKKVEIVGELGLTRALIISSISINLFFFVKRNLLRLNTNFSQGITSLH